MTKRLITAVLALLCLAAIPFVVLGGTPLHVTIDIPYYHVWKTNVPDADDRFTYRWTAETEGEPMPEGVTGNYWDWMLQGNTEGILSLRFVFDSPGTYSYRLAAYVPEPKDGYVYEPRVFQLTVHVKNTKSGEMEADWNLLNEASGDKVDRLDLDPSYERYESTEDPGETSESPEETTAPPDHTVEQPTQEEPGGTDKTGKTVKTGDETMLLSLMAILTVSAMLLIFLALEKTRKQ